VTPARTDLSDVVVAVLDTGVAWRDRPRTGGRVAPGLSGTRFVAPADFIEMDGQPDDDHQHGTHVASLIASTASPGGVAAGVRLMPVKVLDRDDVGTELALVDGIHHAVSHGARIVNMSLSFGAGYVPGPALIEALERAHHAGVLLIAAAGNEGGEEVTQPAASPLVLAVGATRPSAGGLAPASYSNASPRVDLVAPGGSLDADRNGDQVLDGIPAETISLQDPTRTGLWMYAGTSQAAALVTGIAAHLMHGSPDGPGLDASRARVALSLGATPSILTGVPWEGGHGRGQLTWAAARAAANGPLLPARRPCVSMLAWLEPGARGLSRPVMRVTVIDERGARLPDAQVIGHLSGTGGGTWSCRTGPDGACRSEGRWRATRPTDSWTWHADTVMLGGLGWHPGAAMFTHRGLPALLAGMSTDARTRGASLAFAWPDTRVAPVGEVSSAVLVVDLDVHRARVPWARLTLPGAFQGAATTAAGSLVVSAAVPGQAPSVRIVSNDAAGPWGWRLLRVGARALLLLDAWAMRASPIGVTAPGLFAGVDPDSRAVRVGTGPVPGPVVENRQNGLDLAGSPLGVWLDGGGAPAEASAP
jgi:hypothetical protein